ncbi:hypothetical protein [Vibrio furnissii]|uniref:hypothetical protein n=1 Tax=Vibrio furnissii TaxID=29494 RepID=UPI001EEA8E44|nr:hypothetical protein [Vibrio furnissii]MCG6268579.1 hypothetical protein [Vibrio furnissii]
MRSNIEKGKKYFHYDFGLIEKEKMQELKTTDDFDEKIWILNVGNENDLNEITLNNKSIVNFDKQDFHDLQGNFGIRFEHYDIYDENALIEHVDVYTIELGNGEINAVLFEGYYNKTGEVYTIDELFDYLNKNMPERNVLNQKSNHKDNKLTQDKMQSLVDRHSPTPVDEPKHKRTNKPKL